MTHQLGGISSVQSFPELIFYMADYRQVSIAVETAFFVAVNRRITVHFKLSCYMVMYLSLMHRLFVVLCLCFQTGAVLLLRLLGRGPESFYFLISSLAVETFRTVFRRLTTEHFFTSRVGTAQEWVAIIVRLLYCIDQFHWRKGGTVLLLSLCSIC